MLHRKDSIVLTYYKASIHPLGASITAGNKQETYREPGQYS